MVALAPALLLLAALHCAGAPEPEENDSRLAKTKPLGKRRKKVPNGTGPDVDTAGTEWTSWFNIDHPGGDGDYETLEAIRFYYQGRVCAQPLALEARTTEWELPRDVGEFVHASPRKGFWCINQEQPEGRTCSNYHVRFLCPLEHAYWSHWSAWSACSRTACGSSGIQTRHRACVNPQPLARPMDSECAGKALERRVCSAGPCAEATWGPWGAWSPCSKTCGSGGKRLRRRSCKKSRTSRCAGRPSEVQKCARTPCPACQLTCAAGKANKDCSGCTCPDHTLLGTVVSAEGSALANARVALQDRPQATLARTDQRGRFRVPGVCAGSAANVTVQLERFSPGAAPVIASGPQTSTVQVTLRRLEKPYMVMHPDSKVRTAGQQVTLCCKASGTPVPRKYYWYHNGTLLDRKVYRYDGRLVLKELQPRHAGAYHCKASSDAGAIKSAIARLTVLGKGQPSCRARPEQSLIRLPGECFPDASGSPYYDVGRCPATRCAGSLAEKRQCRDDKERCCGVRRMELREVRCAGYVLPIKVVAECGCETCAQPKVLVQGRVVAADDGEPLRFGQVFLGQKSIGFTGYQGAFTIEVPPGTRRLVVRFVDPLQKFLDTVKVLPFDSQGSAVYQDVRVMRKKTPMDLDAAQTNALPLGELAGEGPVGELVFPAGAFRRASGEPYNGTVKASVTFLDPRDAATVATASSDLSFVNAEGDMVPLRTYGMFAVDLRARAGGERLQASGVEVRMDAGQVRMPEHLPKMKLWSLNPTTGLWEEEGALRPAPARRGKREERTFLVGNLEIRERRLFNLDVSENRRCFVKVRAYGSEKFSPLEQLQGVVVTLVNLEPRPGYPANPRAWGRFDSAVTGRNGACLPAFCDGQRADAYTAYVTATLGGEELEAAASRPSPDPSTVGVSQPYLSKLGYRRLDHTDPRAKKTAFRVNLAKPNPNNVDEVNGPLYPYRSLRECEEAPVSANHFRFSRAEVDKYEYNVVPFEEGDLTSWTRDYLAWWPNPQEFRACYIKVKVEGPQEYMVRSRNVGGSHPWTQGQLYGLRDARSVKDPELEHSSAACVEFKCSGMLFDHSGMDRTLVSIVPQGSCYRTATNSLLREYLGRHPPAAPNNDTRAFHMLAPVDPLGHNYGIYTVTDQNPRLAKEIAIGRCFHGTSDGFSREMKSEVGTAVTFLCQERPAGRQSLFQRLLEAPAEALTEIRQEMGRSGQP
ncbi:cartilage intermediate layer protein 2 isoform X2 [Alligator mississippiensis]|uniref:cartilage intermediate layer protein 2 isoform X2 n=1 Tax=Alligator mississippiensis TaxID=8496 RepID=UPI0028776A5D|nr:cartilage intermediate layer protein 2 isoform X2 [Alligator mississippiensis]